jgi:hypothetical protein
MTDFVNQVTFNIVIVTVAGIILIPFLIHFLSRIESKLGLFILILIAAFFLLTNDNFLNFITSLG